MDGVDDSEGWETRQPDLRIVKRAERDELTASIATRALSAGAGPSTGADPAALTVRLSEELTAGFELEAAVLSAIAGPGLLVEAAGTRRVVAATRLAPFSDSEAPKSSAS